MGKQGGPRDVTPDELRELLVRATHRLSRHLNDHIDGEFAAIDDVASVMRILCGTGRGNNLVVRTLKASGIASPKFHYAQALDTTDDTVLALGAFPQINRYEDSDTEVSIDEWLSTPALVVADSWSPRRGAKLRTTKWGQLIYELANVRGSHASQTLAPWLEVTRVGGINGISLPDYVIECAAVIIEDILRPIMHDLGQPTAAPRMRDLPIRDVGINQLQVDRVGSQMETRFHRFTSARIQDGEHPMLSLTVDGVTQEVFLVQRGERSHYVIRARGRASRG